MKPLRYLIFAAIAAFFIYLAFRNADLPDLWNKVKSANFMWIGLAWIAGMLSNLSRAIRWTYIIEPLGFKTKKSNSFHGVMVGYLVNFAIPRGGEITRAAMLSKVEKIPLPTVLGSIVAERVMDVLCMGLVLILALLLQFDTIISFFDGSAIEKMKQLKIAAGQAVPPEGQNDIIRYLVWAGVIIGFLAFVLFLIFRKKYNHIKLVNRINLLLISFADGIKGIVRLDKPFRFIAHSIFIWLMYYLMVYLCFFCIPATADLGFAAGLTVLVLSTVAVLIPAPGGLGTFHTFVPVGLMIYGIIPDDGLAYATIAHATQMIMFMVFGTVSLVIMVILQRKALAE